jgi:hypothetical protein
VSGPELSGEDLDDLGYAKQLLENPSLAARIANAVGAPVEKLFGVLPEGVTDLVLSATNKALTEALNVAIVTLGDRPAKPADGMHKLFVALTGAAGGAFGLPALTLELPASTTLMLRSIADIARSHGESMQRPETKLACLQVFSLGGPRRQDDAVESGYFAVRAALAGAMSEAAEHIARHGLSQKGAPALLRLTAQIAARFGIPVSEKVVAQSVPIIGAAGGAAINLVFIDHFQQLARGHFTVRRLERQYGAETIRRVYLSLGR